MKRASVNHNMEKVKGKEKSNLKEVLIASEIRYRRLFESAKTGILILDAVSGMIVDVNPFLIDLLGYSKEEFIEKSIWEIGSFKDIYENKDKFLELQQSEYVRYEDLPLETSDGSKIHVEFVSNVYLVNNNKVIQCQIRDITARKETEAALEKTRKELAKIKKSEDELNEFTENIIDTVREPLLAIDKDLRVIKANRSFYKFFKVTADETIGKLIYELGNHQWDIPKLKELLEKIIPEKNTFDNYEVEHNFSNIGKRVMLLNARQVKSAFGKEKIILLAIEDITKRKGKEDSLQETHSSTSGSLNTLLDLMQAPIIIWDTSMIIRRFNRKFELLSGYDSAEVIGKKIDFLFPKEMVAATLELLKNHLEDEPEVDEIAILTKDNHIKTVLWNSSNILDEAGKNIIATISQDITNRKLLEDALNHSETRYRRLFETAKDGILILDAETGKIVDVNPFLIDLLGFSKKEIIEKSIWEIGAFKDIYENKEKFLELQQKEYARYDDLPLVTSDGRKINVEFVSNVYLSNNIKVIQCNIRDNTERKKVEDALHESEIKYRAFFENSMDAILLTSPDGKTQSANQAACSMFGYSEDELIKLGRSGIVDATDPRLAVLLAERKLKGKAQGEATFIHKDGTRFPAEISSAIFKDHEGIERTSMIIRDITERKKTEKEIRDLAKIPSENPNPILRISQNGTLLYVNEAGMKQLPDWKLQTGQSAPTLLQGVVFNAINIGILKETELEHNEKIFSFYVTPIVEEGYANLYGWDITERKHAEKKLRESEFRFKQVSENAQELIWEVNKNGVYTYSSPVIKNLLGYELEEIIGKKHYYDFFDPENKEKLKQAALDILANKKSFKDFVNVNLHKDGRKVILSSSGIPMLDNLGNLIGYQGVDIDITERVHAEKTLLKLSSAIEQTVDSIVITDRDGIIEYVNQAFMDKTGYSREEALGNTPRILKSGTKDQKYYEEMWKTILSGKVFREEVVNKKKNGDLYDVEKTISPIFDKDKNITHFVGTGIDITERKRTEEALRESEQLYRSLFENMLNGFAYCKMIFEDERPQDFIYLAVNNSFEILTGLKDVVGKKVSEVIPGIRKSDPILFELYGRVALTGIPETIEIYVESLKMWYAMSVYSPGNECFVSIFDVITERKNAEEVLLQSEAKFRNLINSLPDPVLVVDSRGRIVYCNENAVKTFEYNIDEMLNCTMEDLIPKHFRKLHISLRNEYISEPKSRAMGEGKELFAQRKGGEEFPTEIMLEPVEINGNHFTLAIVRDITERKQVQNELKLQANLLSNVGQAVIATDLSGKITYWNNAAEKIYGWTPAEAIGQNIMRITPTQSTREQATEIMKKLSEGESWSGEFRVKRKDGSSFPAFVNNTPTFDADRKLTGIIGISSDITERKIVEIALKESELRFRNLYDNAKIGLYRTTPDGTILMANRFLLKMLGYQSFEKLAERKLKDDGFAPTYNRKDFLEKIEKGGEVNNFESAWKHTDGSIFYVSESALAVRNSEDKTIYYDGVVEDITQRKMAEADIAMLSQSLKSVNESVSITDLEDKIIFVNQSFLDTYGYKSKELIGKPISLVRSPINEQNQVSEILSSTIRGEWQGELINKRKNGSEFPVYLSTTVVKDTDNKILGLIGVATDITERKRAEMELIEAKEKAEENDRLKTSFLANMSHEIRTPMNGILGFTGLLKNHGLSGDEQQEFIGVIEKSGARLLNIINDIICISKIESEKIPITLADANINEFMEFIYNFFKPETNQKKLYFSYNNALPDEEAFINTDSEKVYAILTNLVKNAIKFTEMGYIETGYTVKNGFIEFYVSDSGTGIPEEQREYIFERFRQGNDAFTRNYEGAGLGLAISKAYVEMLGGKIWMKNRSEEPTENGDAEKTGSVFYFTIPANFTQNTITYIPINDIGDKTIINSKKLKILIVEDDMNSELLLRIYVKMFAKEILHVSNGIEAVEMCEKNSDIDLILMDIKLPGMNGDEATRKIRLFNKHVVIIAQTAYALSDDKEKAIAAGCNNYVTKPVDELVLNEMINSYFK